MMIYNRLMYIRINRIKICSFSTLVNFPLANCNSTNSLDRSFDFNTNITVINKVSAINISNNKDSIASKEYSTASYLSTQITNQLNLQSRDSKLIWDLYTKLNSLKNQTYCSLLLPSQFQSIIKTQFDLQTIQGYNRVLKLVSAFKLLNYELTPKICHLTCQSYYKLNKLDEMEAFIESIINSKPELLTTKLSNQLIKSYMKNEKINKAYTYITKLSNMGIQWDIHSLVNLCHLNLKLGKINQFYQVYRSILVNFNQSINDRHFNELLNSVLNQGYWNLTDKLVKDMKKLDLKPNLVTLTILMNSLLKLVADSNKCHPGRIQCIDSIYKQLSANENVILDDAIKLSFARWYCKIGNLKRAKYVLNTLQSSQAHANFILFEAYIQHNKINKALELYEKIHRENLGDDIRIYNLIGRMFWSPNLKLYRFEAILDSIDHTPNVGKFNLVLGFLVSKMRIMDAYKLYQKHVIKGNTQSDIFTYSTLFKGLCSAGRNNLAPPIELQEGWLTMAKEIYGNMIQDSQLVINLPVYNSILNTFSYFGDWDQVLQIYQTILDNDYEPNPRTIYPVIRMLLDNVPKEDLANTLDQIPEFLSTPFYNAMIDAILRESDLKGALTILEHMLTHPECRPDSLTYKILLVKAAELQDIIRVQMLLQHCQDKQIEFNCSMYESIIKSMLNIPKSNPEYDMIIYKVNMLRKVEEIELEEEMNFEELSEENSDWNMEENFHERLSPQRINQLVYECFLSVIKLNNNNNNNGSSNDN